MTGRGLAPKSQVLIRNSYEILEQIQPASVRSVCYQLFVRNIISTCDRDRPLIALYVGDWDPSGLCMSERDLPKRLAEYGANVELVRIALTESDINFGGLPSFSAEAKVKDPRYKWFKENFGNWELDTLPPPVLRQRVRQAILSHLDIEAGNHCAKVEAAELENLRSFNWKGLFSDQSQNSGKAP